MKCETAPFQVTARSTILSCLILSLFVVTPPTAYADSASEGPRGKFQVILTDAWHNLMAGKPSKKRAPFNIAPGEKHLMACTPEKVSSRDKKFTISFGDIDIPKSFSLVFVDEFRKVLVVAATSSGAYIDDNTIQPELIKRNSTVATEPDLTYAHMNDTGYPYGAFGPSGTYAILLVDDAIDFERHRVSGETPGIVTNRGNVPSVIAGCAISSISN